jgi:hypothetical protein
MNLQLGQVKSFICTKICCCGIPGKTSIFLLEDCEIKNVMSVEK